MSYIEIAATITVVILIMVSLIVAILVISSIVSWCYFCIFRRNLREDVEMTNLDFSSYITPIDINEGKCIICFDGLEEKEICKIVTCDHVFHKECINKWLNVKQNCPCCRTSIYKNDEEIIIIV